MAKWILRFCMLGLFALPVESAAQIVRDHRGPGAAAQWDIDGGPVDSLSLHRLYNTERAFLHDRWN